MGILKMKTLSRFMLFVVFLSIWILMRMISGEEYSINTESYIPFDLEDF
jgi:hypothetical protein